MKKIYGLFITGILIGLTTQVNAQTWLTSGSNIYYNLGNVGIGTASPSGHLSIYKAGGATFSMQDGTNSRFWFMASGNALQLGGDGSTSPTSGAISILNSGNVGIGTATPTYKLHVNGTLGISGATTISNVLTIDPSSGSDALILRENFMYIRDNNDKVINFQTGAGVNEARLLWDISLNEFSLENQSTATKLTLNEAGINLKDNTIVTGTLTSSEELVISRNTNAVRGLHLEQTAHADSPRLIFSGTSGGFGMSVLGNGLSFRSGAIYNSTSGTERMRLTDSKFHVKVNTDVNGFVTSRDGIRGAQLRVDAAGSGNRAMLILDPDASDGIGVGSDYLTVTKDGANGDFYNEGQNMMRFNGNTSISFLRNAEIDGSLESTGSYKQEASNPTLILNETDVSDNNYDIQTNGGAFRIFNVNDARTTFTEKFQVLSNGKMNFLNGNVGIGTSTPDSKLTVAGTVKSQEVIVEATAGADFVFEDNYDLPTLAQIEQFIKANKHLEGIASAEEMKANGVKVGELQIQLLQKIEELTLYTIEQERKLDKEKNTNNTQQSVIEQLLSMNNELLKRIEKLEKKEN